MKQSRKVIVFSFLKHQLCWEMKILLLQQLNFFACSWQYVSHQLEDMGSILTQCNRKVILVS